MAWPCSSLSNSIFCLADNKLRFPFKLLSTFNCWLVRYQNGARRGLGDTEEDWRFIFPGASLLFAFEFDIVPGKLARFVASVDAAVASFSAEEAEFERAFDEPFFETWDGGGHLKALCLCVNSAGIGRVQASSIQGKIRPLFVVSAPNDVT